MQTNRLHKQKVNSPWRSAPVRHSKKKKPHLPRLILNKQISQRTLNFHPPFTLILISFYGHFLILVLVYNEEEILTIRFLNLKKVKK
jgi:hypothetical protein